MLKSKLTTPLALILLLAGAAMARADILPEPQRPQLPPFRPAACEPAPIRSVDQAHIDYGPPPRIVATGTAATAGSRDVQLRFKTVLHPKSHKATAVYEFVACTTGFNAEVLSPVSASTELDLDEVGPIRQVIIQTATNRLTLNVDERRRDR